MTLTPGEAQPLVPNEKTVKAIKAARRGELTTMVLRRNQRRPRF